MKRTPAEEILGEWGIRDVSPASQRERDQLYVDRDLNPFVGKRLRRRLRQIEELTREHERRLEAAYAERDGDWRRLAERWDFGDVNELIERHNRFYPIEARLPMDPRSRDFVKVGGRHYRRRLLDVAWVLERFPA